MIIRDFADAFGAILWRSTLVVGASVAGAAALVVLAVVLIAAAVTGNVPRIGRRREQPGELG
ncbi:hypothetical protein [Streptomyces sp. NPDC050145]|uniref:hypothetical protein n=1 Tax=Streptomyces sp. NPDC050145 TaxID=3365602 RepID=UPI00378DAB2A